MTGPHIENESAIGVSSATPVRSASQAWRGERALAPSLTAYAGVAVLG